MKYMLIIGHDENFGPSRSLISRIVAWNDAMREKGTLLDSHPLKPWDEAKTVRTRNGKVEVDAGSFSDSANKISAYALVECRSEAEAIAVASTHPMAAEAVVEVRPIWEGLSGG